MIELPVRTGAGRDFDFLVGRWTVANETLGADGVWQRWPSTMRMSQRIGGVVNVDEYDFPSRGYTAMALRIFHLETRQWAIYWIESRAGVLQPPVFGGFAGDRGEFFGRDELAGRPILWRYVWTRKDRDRARWEQAYTPDGETWTTNWVMELARAPAPVPRGEPVSGTCR